MTDHTDRPATGYAARVAVGNRDLERSAASGVYALNVAHSFHHRQLRSHGGPDSSDNLILLTGTGTTGEHGAVHGDPRMAQRVGLIVPSWSTPAEYPVYRRDPYGVGWDWFLQTPDGQLEWATDGRATMAHLHGIDTTDIDAALAVFREMVSLARREASPWG